MDKVLGVWIDEKLIKAFKVHCVKNDVSMESLIREFIEKTIKEKK